MMHNVYFHRYTKISYVPTSHLRFSTGLPVALVFEQEIDFRC